MSGEKRTDFRREVIRADPEWPAAESNVEEYRVGENRVFKGRYRGRGPYTGVVSMFLLWGQHEGQNLRLWGDEAGQGDLRLWGDAA